MLYKVLVTDESGTWILHTASLTMEQAQALSTSLFAGGLPYSGVQITADE